MKTCKDCRFWKEPNDPIEETADERPLNFIGNHYLQTQDMGECLGVPPTPMDNHAGGIYFEQPRTEDIHPACALFELRKW